MRDLSGMKLLVVSGDGYDVAFVNAAREMGIYVVCCDGHKDWKNSPAKEVADEAWDIDYSHTDEVVKKCKETGIDGVIAGYGENRVIAACRISKALGKPFYATEEQINLTRNKCWFKEQCVKHKVPAPYDFTNLTHIASNECSSIRYPVIVKPSDNGGRKGISICENEMELNTAISLAASQSLDGKVVVEEYISGAELSAIYTMCNGEISLSCLNDKYICKDDGASTLCNVVITPSKYYDLYIRTIDQGIKSFLKDLGALNGVANFQLIANEDGIKAFEMGYRINGNDDYKVIRKNNGLDYMKMIIHYSLTGEMGDNLVRDDPRFQKFFATICFYAHAGTISLMDYSAIVGKAGIEDISVLRKPGAAIVEDGTNKQKILVIKLSAETLRQTIELIDFVQQNVAVIDENGNDMLLSPFDTDRLLS